GRILAALQTRRITGGAGLPEGEPEGPRDALSRRVSERAGSRREARRLSRGAPMVRRLSRVVPEGRRFADDQLPARGPCPRAPGFQRGGEAVCTHSLRIPAAS